MKDSKIKSSWKKDTNYPNIKLILNVPSNLSSNKTKDISSQVIQLFYKEIIFGWKIKSKKSSNKKRNKSIKD